MGENKYLIGLNMIEGIGSKKIFQLLEVMGSAENVWNAGVDELCTVPGIGRKIASHIKNQTGDIDPNTEIQKAKDYGAKIITIYDKEYPYLLKNIYDPPPVIYIKGNEDVLKGSCIGVVGTRRCSSYGRVVARRISGELAACGMTIVSGMARGIDSEAHMASISLKGKTIAVIGCGIDICYPPENRDLYKKIISTGLIISAYPFGTKPFKYNFPARNRIISGLSLGILVVEAGVKSGALITSDFALEQNREVFAIPGSIYNSTSIGCNKLIKQGAKLVECVDDILEELKCDVKDKDNAEGCVELTGQEKSILMALSQQPTHLDIIVRKCKKSVEEVTPILLQLELKGLISSSGTGNYVKVNRRENIV